MSSNKLLPALLVSIFIAFVPVPAQQLRVGGELTDREQDGFSGAVRRVRVETARITIKEGKPVEGARVIRAVTTYDIKGKRVDTVAHPVQVSTPAGREQYRYDSKGNMIEMTVLATDGSILSRENYEYEFDQIGNWKKMVSSVVTFEDGKLALEPIEVTYRTLTYYYNQTIDTVVKSSQASPVAPAITTATNVAAKPPATSTDATPIDTGKPTEKETAKQDGPNAQVDGSSTSDLANAVPTTAAQPVSVKHVSESVLRSAATNIPAAEMPIVGQLQPMYRKVQVHIVVDEKGDVVSARGTSPETVFNDAAETAARKAKFVASKLSETPARVFSILSYEFATEVAQPAPPPVAKPESQRVALEREATPPPTELRAGAAAEPPDPLEEGVTHLANRQYARAEEFFKGVVYKNPEDARGYSNLGFAYFGRQKHAEAVAAFKLALRLRPDLADARTYYLMGASYHALKKYSEGIKALKQGIYVLRASKAESGADSSVPQPTVFQFQYNLGVLYYSVGANFEAIKSFREAASLQPGAPEPSFGLALVYLSMGDRTSAEREQRTLKKKSPELANKLAEALAGRVIYIPPGCNTLPCL